MPRRNRRNTTGRYAQRPLPRDGSGYWGTRVEEGPSYSFGRDYYVREMGGPSAVKDYVCPGCQGPIYAGTAHIVAWPKDTMRGAADRRHWHRACWARR